MSHLWLAITFDTRERISVFFFGRNVTDKVNNQPKDANMPPQSNDLCFCATWQNRETRKLHFHSNALLLHCQNSTSCCLISSTFLVILTLLYDSLNLVIDAFSSGLLGAWFKRKGVKSAVAIAPCCMHMEPVRCLLGFLFCKVMLKHWIGEVRKQSTVWFLILFSLTLLLKLIVIGLCMSRL